MTKSEFTFRFFAKEVVLLFLGEEIFCLDQKKPNEEPLNIPFSWYSEAIEIWRDRTKN